jgi:hypothetical protein
LEPWRRPLDGVAIDRVGGYIRFKYREPYLAGRQPPELASSDRGMLLDFADLCRGDCVADRRLFRFASRYGELGLCKEHGWPQAHIRPYCAPDSEPTADGENARERIRNWLFFSELARTIIVAFTSKARREKEDAVAELRTFIAAPQGTPEGSVALAPYNAILHWLRGGDIKLWFRSRRLTLYGAPPLWTALGLELATFAVRANKIILCSACGRLDSTKHSRGNGSRRSYCSKCRVRGRKRDAAADLRGRRRRTRELHAQGKSDAEIVRELGLRPAQVKRYLKKRGQ